MTFHNVRVGGRDAVIVMDESIDYGVLVSSLVEQIRRVSATRSRESVDAMHCLAEGVIEGIRADLGDIDPEVVCRVALVLCSTALGPMFLYGANPADAMNAVSLAAVTHAGHYSRPQGRS